MPESIWYCPHCYKMVRPVDVTHEETHDVRAGGCGQPVVSLEVPEEADQNSDFFVLPNAAAAEWLYVSTGGEVVRLKASTVRKMREALKTIERIFDVTTIDALDTACGKVQDALASTRGEEVV